jgi:hypothetical protein
MARPNIDDALASIQAIGDRVLELGIDKVAEQSGLKPTIVRKFTVDCMRSKNTDIRKISAAVSVLEELRKI